MGGAPLAQSQQDVRVCADDAQKTLPGMDVSVYQGDIDWEQVRASGIVFAIIRTNHGLHTTDSKFAQNWAGARAAGVVRGAYQYWDPNADALAQAQRMLDIMGPLDPGDLPPVIDVEENDTSRTSAQMRADLKTWLDKVSAATGRTPIIYTTVSYWSEHLANTADFAGYPLWIANIQVECPSMPPVWDRWTMWQYSWTGDVPGISGDVDLDQWNGDRASLDAFIGGTPVCGDDGCTGDETAASCAMDCAQCTVAPEGAIIDDDSSCFVVSGPPGSWRNETAGYDESLRWTYAWEQPESNSAVWNFDVAQAGKYRLDVHTPMPWAGSKAARYEVHHDGTMDEVVIDQTAHDGWQRLGTFQLAAGAGQFIRLGDHTGEPYADRRQLVFDAVRFSPSSGGTFGGDDDVGGDDDDDGSAGNDGMFGGCATGGRGGASGWLLVGLAIAVVSRRRR